MDQTTEFLLYTAPGGKVAVEVFLHDENIWLPQTRIGELFGTTKQNVGQHLKNIFSDGELDEDSVVKEFFTTAADGKNYKTKYYNLDAIISVGYRVNSSKATQFRIWATERLREFIVKGFVLDDERLKNGRYFGKDYFRELLERVRSIRASERRIYQQITDIFAECSEDYDKHSEEAHLFYAHVQDKFHFAITGQTSSELIHQRADADKPWMGLQTYKNAPDGRVLLSDTKVGKNYLAEDEIKQLERTVSSFFDYIERIIESRTTFTMRAFADSVNRFLEFNEYKVLEGYGSISRKQADAKARSEYEKFNATQRIESDFDKAVKAIEAKKEGGE
jgi:hypothetical protein